MRKYVVKFKDLYVDHIGEDFIDLVGEMPKYGLTDNLIHARKQLVLLKKMLGDDGEILEIVTSVKKKEVEFNMVIDLEDDDKKYYVFENDNSQVVKGIEDTGDIELSFQQPYKMTKAYQAKRVERRMEEYGLEGYKLKEVTVQKMMKKVEVNSISSMNEE